MIYAIFMLMSVAVLALGWRRNRLELPLFLLTVACVMLYLILDMTTPLTLSF